VEVAAEVASSCADLGIALVVAASNAVRCLDLTPPAPVAVFASRGAAGIDGTVSTAGGIALGLGKPVRALVGDLAMAHDAGGLGRGEWELPPDLDVVVCQDHGGGVFRELEHARAAAPEVFARYFLAPQAVDLGNLARAHGARHTRADSVADLRAALAQPPRGVRVIEAPISRAYR
jgi:2-succinyl-5-enolpyruvyl-6-hydroxy-3-cyclohexene-1-carboxylate synthase